MQPPAGIDMSLIREAMQRRMQGGGGVPMAQQVSMPQSGQTPLQTPPPVSPTAPLTQQGQPQSGAQQQPQPTGQRQAGGASAGGNFDDDTKAISKALIVRLMKLL